MLNLDIPEISFTQKYFWCVRNCRGCFVMLERRRVASGSSGNVIVVSGLHRLQSGRFCVTFLLLKFLTSHLSVLFMFSIQIVITCKIAALVDIRWEMAVEKIWVEAMGSKCVHSFKKKKERVLTFKKMTVSYAGEGPPSTSPSPNLPHVRGQNCLILARFMDTVGNTLWYSHYTLIVKLLRDNQVNAY